MTQRKLIHNEEFMGVGKRSKGLLTYVFLQLFAQQLVNVNEFVCIEYRNRERHNGFMQASMHFI